MIVRCTNGHHYDAQRFPECPYCIQIRDRSRLLQGAMEAERGQAFVQEEQLRQPESFHRESESDRTIGMFSDGFTDYVTGWLVCVEGPLIGMDFRIRHGQNWAGTRTDEDICFQGADGIRGIEERHHCCFVYDGRHGVHYLVPGEAGGMVFCQGQALRQPVKLSGGDRIRIGNCSFVFIPFCMGRHTWVEEKGMLRWSDGADIR